MENRTYSTDPRTLLIEKIDERIKKEKEEGRAPGRIERWILGESYYFDINAGIARRWIDLSETVDKYQRISPFVNLFDLEEWRMSVRLADKEKEKQLYLHFISPKERFNKRLVNFTYHLDKIDKQDTHDFYARYEGGMQFPFNGLSFGEWVYPHLIFLVDHLTTLTGSVLPSNLPVKR